MMGDACICVDTEGEYIEWDERQERSGAPRKCAECDRTIPPGAPHVHHFGLTEPEFDADDAEGEWEELHRECLCCAAVRSSLFECGWFVGCVWSALRDHMLDVMPMPDDDDDGDESWCDPPTKPIGPEGW